VFENVRFVNLSNPAQNGWKLTGAVTLYESPVTISACEFDRTRAEDALNIIRGKFVIQDSVFRDSLSDALDIDFGGGRIARTSFLENGNDGIDVSGTTIEIEDIFIDGAGDKAVSAGENSRLTGRRLIIRNAEVAVASKDRSEVRLDETDLESSRVGLTVFEKKSEFGPAQLWANTVSFRGVEAPYLIESGSEVNVDGHWLDATHANVKELMYGAEYGRRSD